MLAPVTLLGFALAASITLPLYTPGSVTHQFPFLSRGFGPPDNVLVNNPSADLTIRDTQSGTAIVRGAGNAVIVAFNDSGSNVGSTNHFTGWARSTDGGVSFIDQGTLPNSTPGDAGYMNLARDTQTGVIYLSALGYSTQGLNVFRSIDNGVSFLSPPTPVAVGSTDLSSIAVDNFPGTGQGTLYVAWRDFTVANAIRLAKSTNAGVSFLPAVQVQSAATGNVNGPAMAIASDHTIYIAYLDETAPKSIKIRKSTDLGVSFAPPVTVAGVTATGVNGNLGLGFAALAFPKLAVNPVSGNLYVVYPDKGPGTDRADIYFTQSTDGGVTWTPRVKINNDGTTNDQYQPVLSVTPDGTRLFMGFYDRRRDPANSLIDVYGMVADASVSVVTAGVNFRISSESFPPAYGQDPSVISAFMGHYDTATADNSFFYYPWGDNRLGNSFHPAGQPDVRMAKIPVDGIPVADLIPDGITLAGSLDDNALNPDECNTLIVDLRNVGSLPLTNISATVSSTNPELTVVQSISAYPNLGVGTSSANLLEFQIRTSSSYPCYVASTLTLNVSTSQGNFSFPITLPGSPLGTITESVTFTNATPLAIPDVSTVISTIGVIGLTQPVIKATVRIYATHTFDNDLEIRLITPEGTTITLVADRGGPGDNFGTSCSPVTNMTVFDDDAATPISAGVAPFAGSYRPEEPLSAIRGTTAAVANGTWQLAITDDLGGDVGTLHCWSLEFFAGACDEGTGPCGPTAANNWMLFE